MSKHPFFGGRLLGLSLPAAALAALACSDGLLPLPQQGPPEAMEFTTGGFAAHTYRLEVRGDTVVAWLFEWSRPAPVDSARSVPDPAEWQAFWEAAEEAGVQRWRKYRRDDVVDGGGYALTITHEGRTLESWGSNAWPDHHGREHHEVTEAYLRFRDALDVLVGRPLIVRL